MKPGFRFPWWLAILLVIGAVRLWTNISREMPSSSSPRPAASGNAEFKVYTSTQPGEAEVAAACQKAIDVSNGSESIPDFKKHAPETARVCSAAYEYALKDAAQDTEVAHYMDENNAATDEEMVTAALGLQGDKAGSREASNKAVALAQDVVAHSNEPHLIAAAKETIRELTGPISR